MTISKYTHLKFHQNIIERPNGYQTMMRIDFCIQFYKWNERLTFKTFKTRSTSYFLSQGHNLISGEVSLNASVIGYRIRWMSRCAYVCVGGGILSYPMSFQILPTITKSSKSHLQASFVTSQSASGLTCNTAQPKKRKQGGFTSKKKKKTAQAANTQLYRN